MRIVRRQLRSWRGLIIATGIVSGLASFAVSARQNGASDPIAAAKLTTVLQDLAGAVPQDRSDLGVARSTAASQAAPLDVNTLPKPAQDALHTQRLRLNSANEIQVYVLMTPVTIERLQQLTAAGATIEIAAAAPDRVQARVPASRLLAVAALDFVNFVKLPSYAVRHEGGVLTEGDAIMHADTVRSQFFLDGTGVRVGVLSDGLKGVFASGCTTCGGVANGPIATRDLPAATGTRSATGVLTQSSGGIGGRSFQANTDLEGLPSGACGFAGAGAEGTALLEIVHDLAPSARLSFANADTDLAFNQAVTFLASTNDVVVDDLGFFGLPYDGTSSVSSNTANALNNSSFPIRTYVTAAGNDATSHYLGSYVNSGLDGTTVSGITTSGHLHLFQATADTTDVLGLGALAHDVISLPHGGEVVIFLTWDDKFGASSNNYDLYLIDPGTGRVVAKSTDVQSGTQDPVEALDYTNTGNAGLFQIAVQNVRDQAQPKQLNMYSFEPECATDGPRLLAPNRHERHNYNTIGRSVAAQSDAGGSPVGVIAVGAICSASAAAQSVFVGSTAPDESCNDGTHGTIEYFSSRGPTIDGRTKPDISAIDGVSITAAGSFDRPFFGTSAAAPHVAGEAALLLQGAPCLISGATGAADVVPARTALRNLLVQNTAAGGTPAQDNTFGFGRADAFAAAMKTLPIFRGTASLTVSGNTPGGASLGPAALGFVDPNGCGLTRVSWTGGCGSSPGSTMVCPFGTSTVSVGASNNGMAFSPAAPLTVTVTNFAVGAAPGSATVVAGQSAVYSVAVSALGGAFTDPITLGCSNLPTGVSCSFNPATVVPGSTSAQSTVTVSTTSQATAPPSGRPVSVWPIAVLLVFIGSTVGYARFVRFARVDARPAFAYSWNPSNLTNVLCLGVIALQLACSSNGSTPPPSSTAPAAMLAPASLSFGNRTKGATSAAQSVTFTNSGTAALSIAALTASGDFAETNNCGGSLAAGASCTIQVTFTPSAAGARAGALTVTDNASTSPQLVPLSGTGDGGVTTAGTYQIGITGTASALAQTSTVTLVVQ